jgi:HEPN domain-containing protein
MRNIKTQAALQDFLSLNRDAWRFAKKASDDYLLARFGLLNALWSGFEMATQATEKLIKSYLLFADLSLKGSAEEVRKAVSKESKSFGRTYELGHDVEACLSLASRAGLSVSKDLKDRIKRINEYYALRYPDNGGPTSLGTNEVNDVDEAIFEIWDAFEKFNEDYFYVSGIMIPVYSQLQIRYHEGNIPFVQHSFQIMTKDNTSYNVRKAKLEEGIYSRLKAWYPVQP